MAHSTGIVAESLGRLWFPHRSAGVATRKYTGYSGDCKEGLTPFVPPSLDVCRVYNNEVFVAKLTNRSLLYLS